MYTYIFNPDYFVDIINKSGYDRKSLGMELNTDPVKIHYYKNGKFAPKASFLGDFCTLMDIEPNYFFDVYETEGYTTAKFFDAHSGCLCEQNNGLKYTFDRNLFQSYLISRQLSYVDIESYTDIGTNTLSRWVNGITCPSVNSLGLLCGPLEITPSDLYSTKHNDVRRYTK